ncbi:MAG: dCMP deaminase family protein [Verrucomicrobiota bacterium]|nr:dCMP deaminase family protein [Verrucomicrobiota bacterium]
MTPAAPGGIVRAMAERFGARLGRRANGQKVGWVMGKDKAERPDWDTYFMNIARVVATRGNCARRKVAALLVKDQQIISTGYNGTPRGVKNCCEGGCPRCRSEAPSGTDLQDCICSHAEENAITQAAYHGIAVRGGTLYCTLSPCLICAKMIINSGIVEVVFENAYEFSRQTKTLLMEAGVYCRQLRRR